MQFTLYSWRDLLRMAGLAIAYALLAKLVLNISTANGNVTVFWVPGGFALASLLILGRKYWPAIFIGATAAGVLVNDPLGVSVFLALGNTLETLCAIWLCNRFNIDMTFKQPKDFLHLAYVASLSAIISALIGPLSLLAAGFLHWQNITNNIFHWWQGDALGILLSTPLFLIWRKFPKHWFARQNIAETFAFLCSSIFIGQVVFLGWLYPLLGHVAKGYWMFIFVAWGATRFGQHGAALVICITAIQALLGATLGLGYFAQDIAITGLQNFWFYLLTLTFVGIAALGIFVEAQKRAEVALRDSESKLRTIFNIIPDLIWMKDTQGVFLACNSRIEGFFGKPESEILGKTDYDFVDKELADFFRQHDLAAMNQKKKLVNEEMLSFANDGHLELLETTKTPVFNTQGQLMGVLGIARDITERKRAEINQRIAAIAFESQTGMFVTDTKTNVLRVNSAFTKITGFSAEEIVGKPARIMASNEYDDVFYAKIWQETIAAGHWSGEVWSHRKNGEGYPKYLTITSVKDHDGIVCNYVVTAVDLTDSKNQEQKRLDHEIALRNTLVREVHHRIKNSLQGVTSLLRQSLQQHPELHDIIINAISQIRSIALTHGLQGKNAQSQVLLKDLILEVAANNQMLWHNSFTVDISPQLKSWKVNEEEAVPLALVLNELALNAIKHHQHNTEIRIALAEDTLLNRVTVTFSNYGQLSQETITPNIPQKGTGLTLVDLLLAEDGAELTWEQRNDLVIVRLALKPPAISLVRTENSYVQ